MFIDHVLFLGEENSSTLESTQGFLTRPSRIAIKNQFKMLLNIFSVACRWNFADRVLTKSQTEVLVERLFSGIGLVSQNRNALSKREFAIACSKVERQWFKQMFKGEDLTGHNLNVKHYSTEQENFCDNIIHIPLFECVTR